VPARRQPLHEIDPAVEFRRKRHDADVGRRAVDFGEDVSGREVG